MNDNISQTVEDQLHSKWGETINGYGGGFTAIPNLLLKKQSELDLNPSELNVLVNLIRFWWSLEKLPFPDPIKIAAEMGVSERTLFRTISSLEEKGFIQRIKAKDKRTKYDLTGLVDKLNDIKNTM